MTDAVLVLNVGSSSVKAALFEVMPDHPPRLLRKLKKSGAEEGRSHLIEQAVEELRPSDSATRLIAAGHRIVHGGPHFRQPVLVNDAVRHAIRHYSPAAPYHNRANLEGIETVAKKWPGLAQIACFDTGFHDTLPAAARHFALPAEFAERGIQRYGFHGLSYAYIADRLCDFDPDLAEGRVIVAHLGHGASLCALCKGRSIATTMGFTALDGLPMGKRCGALDPGVVLWMLRQEGRSPDEIEDILHRRSGLLGLSGKTGDMRDLLEDDSDAARFAVSHYVYWAIRHAGSLVAALGGLDGMVFTGGVGENAAPIRAAMLDGLCWLGLRLDEPANDRHALRITLPGSPIPAYVIPTDEEAMIARGSAAVIFKEWRTPFGPPPGLHRIRRPKRAGRR